MGQGSPDGALTGFAILVRAGWSITKLMMRTSVLGVTNGRRELAGTASARSVIDGQINL